LSKITSQRPSAGGQRELARGKHLHLVRFPREGCVRSIEEGLPAFDHRGLAAKHVAATEEQRVVGHQACEGRDVAIGHAARERALGRKHFGAPGFLRACLGTGGRGAHRQDQGDRDSAAPTKGHALLLNRRFTG
jgi:hypothetical protein